MRPGCRLTAAAAAAAMGLGVPVRVAADETRVTVTVRPGSPATPVTMELAAAGSQRILSTLTLSGGGSQSRLTGWNLPLPRFNVHGVSLAPRYGEHQLQVVFQPSALPGLALAPQAVRGVAVAVTGRAVAGTLVAGRLGQGRSLNPLEPAVPHLLAFSGTINLRPGVAISPRVVAPLGDASGVSPAVGVGTQVDFTRHLTFIGDAGGTRSRGTWTPLAIAAVTGRWRRALFEAGASHAGRNMTLLGPVPFAGATRRFSTLRAQLATGVTAEGRLGAVRALDGRRDEHVSRSVALQVDRLPRGTLRLQYDGSCSRSQRPHDVTLEWRRRGGAVAVQLQQQWDQSDPARAAMRLVQIELPSIRVGATAALGVRSSMRLSAGRPGDARASSHLAGRVPVGPVILWGETDLDTPAAGSLTRLRRVVSGADVPLSSRTSLRATHVHTPGDRVSPWRRFEVRISRAVGS